MHNIISPELTKRDIEKRAEGIIKSMHVYKKVDIKLVYVDEVVSVAHNFVFPNMKVMYLIWQNCFLL